MTHLTNACETAPGPSSRAEIKSPRALLRCPIDLKPPQGPRKPQIHKKRGVQTPPRRSRSPRSRLQGRPRGFRMPPGCPRSLPRPARSRPKFSRFNIAYKPVQNVRKLFQKLTLPARFMPITASFLPSPCEFTGTPEIFCPQWPGTMADCQGRGC